MRTDNKINWIFLVIFPFELKLITKMNFVGCTRTANKTVNRLKNSLWLLRVRYEHTQLHFAKVFTALGESLALNQFIYARIACRWEKFTATIQCNSYPHLVTPTSWIFRCRHYGRRYHCMDRHTAGASGSETKRERDGERETEGEQVNEWATFTSSTQKKHWNKKHATKFTHDTERSRSRGIFYLFNGNVMQNM